MKRLRYENGPVDGVDIALLRALAADGRATLATLARAVGLSAPSVAERVRRLEEAGVILGYGARIDPAALGLTLKAHIRVRPLPGQLPKVAEVLAGIEEIVACDRVTGEDCFVAIAHLPSVTALEAIIDRIIPHAMTNTAIVQSSPIPPRLPPLSSDA